MRIISFEEIDDKFYSYTEYQEIDSVKEIIHQVKLHKDKALINISAKYGENISQIELSKEEIECSISEIDEDTRYAYKKAIKNVKDFAEKQYKCIKELDYQLNETTLGHKIIPLQRIGTYVPGGNYPLPSSAIMTIVPARVAGVKEVIMCSPKIKTETIAAAAMAGVDRIFRVGGAQAVAAMAYGTETVPPVDKIVGPGNKYVTMAKREVYGVCGIDFLAGPSEIMVVADETARADFVAADLLSQAEHDADASSVLITTSEKFAQQTLKELYRQLDTLSTKEIAKKALENSCIIVVDSIDQAAYVANKKAPEHLQLCFENADKLFNGFRNYGSLFIGNYSAEVFGDYCSGTNHVLPTNGIARYNGGLSVFDFVKVQTYQIISRQYAQDSLINVASRIASIEGLEAHKNSATIRQ